MDKLNIIKPKQFNKGQHQDSSINKVNSSNRKQAKKNTGNISHIPSNEALDTENIEADLKDMIEKADIGSKVNSFINETIDLLANNIAVGRDEHEKYELLERLS